MPNLTPAGMLALPLAVLTGVLALVSTAAGSPGGDVGARVELEVAGFLPMPESPAGIVVLREKGKETLLPLIVPDGRELSPEGLPRGGLLGRAIEALGARVAEVEIDRAEESTAGARVRMRQGERELELRAVPSESIALALEAKVPIVTTRRLLDESGLTPADLARAHASAAEGEPTRL